MSANGLRQTIMRRSSNPTIFFRRNSRTVEKTPTKAISARSRTFRSKAFGRGESSRSVLQVFDTWTERVLQYRSHSAVLDNPTNLPLQTEASWWLAYLLGSR